MTTKIPAELSSTPGIADSSNATAITIDSSEQIGIGTTSPDRMLHVKGTSTSTVAKFANTGNTVYIELNAADQAGADAGYIAYNNTKDLGFWTDDTERAKIDSSGNLFFNSGFGSVGAAYGVRAWVNFDGTGTPSIRASGNVSSISDNATGKYSVNLTTAMPDTNYAVGGSIANATIPSANRDRVFQAVAHATDEIRVNTYPATDMAHVLVIAFR